MRTLRAAREERGLTQLALAVEADVSLSTVVRAESGRRRPSPRVARQLAAALGVRPEEVVELARLPRAPVVARPRVHAHRMGAR